MATTRDINYQSKDFSTLKEQLIGFAKNYFPDTYSDFSPASPGMMFMEMAAYVGDILSFYQDIQVQETFLQYAKNPANLYAIAYMMGYRPKVTTVSEAMLDITQIVEAVRTEDETGEVSYDPDWKSAVRIAEYSEVKGDIVGSPTFLLRDSVDFAVSSSTDPTEVLVLDFDDEGNPNSFGLKKQVRAFSGKIKSGSVSFGSYKKYQTFEIVDDRVVGILDMVDEEDPQKIWTEVPFLGQDTVFVETANSSSNIDGAPYILSLKKVTRRFVTRFGTDNKLVVQFGSGMYAEDVDQEDFLPNPITLEPGTQDLVDRYDVAYDPSNFLFSNSYGLAPVNCTLNYRYIVGGGIESNVAAHTLTKPGKLFLSNPRTGEAVVGAVFVIDNEKPATGGKSGDTLTEIRQNALRSFAEQKRVVTLKDYNVRALSMPSKFGTISKVYATNEPLSDISLSALQRNPLAITLYILSQDVNGKLTYASKTIRENLKNYLFEYMMVTDAVDFKDAYIVNIGVQYDVVLRPGTVARDVLLSCNEVIGDYLKTENRAINEPINLSELYTLIDQVQGVQTVKAVKILNLQGGNYSKYAYDVEAATKDNIVYPSYDPCIFEVRYPETDIVGRVVTL